MSTPTKSEITKDRALIRRLGGATRLARMLGFQMPGGAARVNNWRTRGIPPAVKLQFPDWLLPELRRVSSARKTGG
jgi:hypothetical protein